MSIKGRAGDEAVLCTANQTYALRLAEATNTLVRRPAPPPLPSARRRAATAALSPTGRRLTLVPPAARDAVARAPNGSGRRLADEGPEA